MCGNSRNSRVTPSGHERERDEPREPARLVLQLAQPPQMPDALGHRLDVPEEHRTGAPPAQAVPGAVRLDPFVAGFLAPADAVAHAVVENFRAAAGQRVQPGVTQPGMSVSASGSLNTRLARCWISTAVKHFKCKFGSSARKLCNSSRYHSVFNDGCSPPTM